MEKPVTVYCFTFYNPVTGRKLSRGPATLKAIEREGGTPLLETGIEVDESELDGKGFTVRKSD